MELVKKRNFIILLAVILVVGFGLMSLHLNSKRNRTTSTNYEAEIQEIETQSTSNEVDDIEKDLDETDLNDIDKELDSMEQEIGSPTF